LMRIPVRRLLFSELPERFFSYVSEKPKPLTTARREDYARVSRVANHYRFTQVRDLYTCAAIAFTGFAPREIALGPSRHHAAPNIDLDASILF